MSLFLLKPHVVGPEGNITSPDIIVDHLFIDGDPAPVNCITHEAWQQVRPCETACAAYGIMALGGGALILPAMVLGSGTVVAARSAWRLGNLDGHADKVQLNGTQLSRIGTPDSLIRAAGGAGDTLPRGHLLVQTAAGDCLSADLVDQVHSRSLQLRVVLEPMDHDRWGSNRPKPRYSVGPTQREVPHFI